MPAAATTLAFHQLLQAQLESLAQVRVLRDFRTQVIAERLGCHARQLGALWRERVVDLLVTLRGADRTIQTLDGRSNGAARREYAVPARHLVLRHALP